MTFLKTIIIQPNKKNPFGLVIFGGKGPFNIFIQNGNLGEFTSKINLVYKE